MTSTETPKISRSRQTSPPRLSVLLGVAFVSLVAGSAATFYATQIYPDARTRLHGFRPEQFQFPTASQIATPSSVPAPAPAPSGPPQEASVSAQSSLSARLDRLEASQGRTNRAARIVIAVVALESAARNGQPFSAQYREVATFLPEGPDRDILNHLSLTGVPTSAALGKSLHDLSNRTIIEAEAPPDSASLPVKLQHWLSSLVILRRDDQTGSGTRSDIVRHAEQLALDGDIAAAQATIDRLPARARRLLAGWSTRASQRIQLDHALAVIRSRALADLTDTPEVGSP